MEHNTDLCVILSCYPKSAQKAFENNPGLVSRINNFFEFEDYTSDELTLIFKQMCEESGYALQEDIIQRVNKIFNKKINEQKNESHANALEARKIYQQTIMNHTKRVSFENDNNCDLNVLSVYDLPKQ